jgi:N-acyl-L-homoserine lactone synthetase
MDWRFLPTPRPAIHGTGVYPAESRSDFDHVEELWRAVYGRELGWLPADAAALHADRFHPHSVYLLAQVDGEVVGTMRLVRDSDAGLPVEQFVSIEKIRDAATPRLIECQRLMIMPDQRNQRLAEMPFGVLGALVKGCLHWCLANGYSHIVADLFVDTPTTPTAPLLALGFTETGLEFVDTELAEPDRSTALLLQVGELFSRAYRCASDFYHYLIAPDPAVDVYH